MTFNSIENLKNKYNTLLSQNLKNNSFIEMSRGVSSKEGSIQDLIFDNTINTKHILEQDLKNKKPSINEDNMIENLLTFLVNPTTINGSLKFLNNSYVSDNVEKHLDEITKGVNKSKQTIKKIFSSIF